MTTYVVEVSTPRTHKVVSFSTWATREEAEAYAESARASWKASRRIMAIAITEED